MPHHGLPIWRQVHTFYNGAHPTVQASLDATTGGTLQNKSLKEAVNLLEEMASNSYQWPTERYQAQRPSGLHKVDTNTALNAKLDALSTMIASLETQGVSCEFCGGNHVSTDCQVSNPHASSFEHANFVSNFNRGSQTNSYSNTYNLGWRNHPNLS